MKVEELKAILENTQDKISVFTDVEKMRQVEDLTNGKLCDLIIEFLNDSEKAQILGLYSNLSYSTRKQIVQSISDNGIKLDILLKTEYLSDFFASDIVDIMATMDDDSKISLMKNSDFIKKYKFKTYNLKEVILSLEDASRVQALRDRKLMETVQLNEYEVRDIIKSLDDKAKKALLKDKDFLENELNLSSYVITDIIIALNEEQDKVEMMADYKIKGANARDIIETFSDKSKERIVIENEYDFNKFHIASIIATMDISKMTSFIKDNKEFLSKKGIKPFEIIRKLDSERQLAFIAEIENIGLTIRRKETNICNIKTRNKRKY